MEYPSLTQRSNQCFSLYILLYLLFHIYALLQLLHLNLCLLFVVFPKKITSFDKQDGQRFFYHLLNPLNKQAKNTSYLVYLKYVIN